MAESFVKRHKCAIGITVVILIAAIVGTVLGILLTRSSSDAVEDAKRAFTINHEKDTFEMDGKPFRYVAGSFHYFRALPQTWRQKLKTLKAGGLNAVDVYIQWSLHNPEDGIYNWNGIANLVEFIEIATELKLYIILRPGPYICAEIDNGGLPYWLATKYPDIKVRTSDANYLYEVGKWYSVLMPKLQKHFYGNGGNIIMIQIENEYGAFGACDEIYKNFLRDETLKYSKDSAVLFTVDGTRETDLKCGQTKDVFMTIDFGLSNFTQVHNYFNLLREFQPTGPLVNTEFWTGWPTHWQEYTARRSAEKLAETLDFMLLMGANVGFYMFYGGTNFGFWAGADYNGMAKYTVDVTSYDYDAPMDEAGNPTDKYKTFRKVIEKYMEVPSESEIPEEQKATSLDALTLKPISSLLSAEGRNFLGTRPTKSDKTLTFEQMKQFSGFVLYETDLPKFTRDPANLVITNLRDRALVYIDEELIGVLSRENYINTLPISADYGSRLSILVENQGRLNYLIADDYKGILGQVRIQSFHASRVTYYNLNDWTITGYPFENVADLERLMKNFKEEYSVDPTGTAVDGPIVFYAEFTIPDNEQLFDTYWDTTDWEKGFMFVNGFNIGRYWSIGPQMTLYVPKDLLKHGKNEIYVVELQKAPLNFKLNFVNGPIFINNEAV